ncbi:MAG: SDR family oxidoreductase [Erysipelotrichaceae bacterium]|nr:SDR family oxidoreductase [Erysipelotrichaceae bacterium]
MKYVLITGASSGIGKELAKQFAKKGHDLILVARREDLLKELKEELETEYHRSVLYYPCDIAKDPKAVYDFCRDNGLDVSVLVNNAGYGDYGPFTDGDIDKLLGMIDLNDKALVALTYHFLKDMKEKGSGHIINTGSVASFIPGPYMAVYYATKAFVLSFSLALREELKDTGIHVSVLCPAPTKSPFWEVAGGETTAVYNNIFARTAKNAAKTGYDLYDSKKAYAIDGPAYKLIIGIARHLPLELCARTIGYLQSKTKKSR